MILDWALIIRNVCAYCLYSLDWTCLKLPSSSKTHTRCFWVVYTFGGSISLVNGQREWNPIENGLRPTALTFILLSVCVCVCVCILCCTTTSRQWKRWGGKKDRKERECVVGDKREITTLRWWQHTKENLWISDDVHRERGRLDFRERKRLPLLYYHFEGLFWTSICNMECWPISSLLLLAAIV